MRTCLDEMNNVPRRELAKPFLCVCVCLRLSIAGNRFHDIKDKIDL